MKKLNDNILLYDKDCPLCCWYTTLFIKFKILAETGRISFQDIDKEKYNFVDYILAQNKIALINTKTNSVKYGIDAITILLNIPFPFVEFLMKIKPVYWLMEKLYMLVSMNRKIIIPISCNKLGSCTPIRSWLWRIIFIIICAIGVNYFVGKYFQNHLAKFFIGNPYYGDILFFTAQLVFQYFACLVFNEKNVYDYLGQVSFVSLLGSVILGVFGFGISILNHYAISVEMLEPFCYGIVFAWMFVEHKRRINLSEMNWRLTYSWILFRILLYPFAFSIK